MLRTRIVLSFFLLAGSMVVPALRPVNPIHGEEKGKLLADGAPLPPPKPNVLIADGAPLPPPKPNQAVLIADGAPLPPPKLNTTLAAA